MPLKGIPPIISPGLLQILASMGHGDEIVLADAHFPTSSICRQGPIEIRADGHKIPELLKAVMQLLPLDTYADSVFVMDRTSQDKILMIPLWDEYRKILSDGENRTISMIQVERFAFYEQAKRAYAVVHTGEMAKYGNIILKKGLVDLSIVQ